MAYRCEPVQLHIMWSWRARLQSHRDDCSLSCKESGPGGGAGCSECRPKMPLIAVPAYFDCSPLHVAVAAQGRRLGRAGLRRGEVMR